MSACGLRLILLVVVIALAPAGSLYAQEWPQRSVKIVVPYAAGGKF